MTKVRCTGFQASIKKSPAAQYRPLSVSVMTSAGGALADAEAASMGKFCCCGGGGGRQSLPCWGAGVRGEEIRARARAEFIAE